MYEVPRVSRNFDVKMAELSALRTGRLYSQEITLVFISVRGWADCRTVMLRDVIIQ